MHKIHLNGADSQAVAELAEAIHAAHPVGSIWDREELEEAIAS